MFINRIFKKADIKPKNVTKDDFQSPKIEENIGLAILVIHAKENRIIISANDMGYGLFYQALQKKSDCGIVIIVVNDEKVRSSESFSQEMYTIFRKQLSENNINGNEGLLLSFDKSPQVIHTKKLLDYIYKRES